MSRLAISVGDLRFEAAWVDAAPRTAEVIGTLLPLRSQLIHCRWSGEGCWIPFGESFLELDPENATSHPAPGEIIVYPGGISECEILVAYGSVDFSSKVGQLWGNHFATIDVGADHLREMGRRVLWDGAQPITIEVPGSPR
jgi:hypothetical protein